MQMPFLRRTAAQLQVCGQQIATSCQGQPQPQRTTLLKVIPLLGSPPPVTDQDGVHRPGQFCLIQDKAEEQVSLRAAHQLGQALVL